LIKWKSIIRFFKVLKKILMKSSDISPLARLNVQPAILSLTPTPGTITARLIYQSIHQSLTMCQIRMISQRPEAL